MKLLAKTALIAVLTLSAGAAFADRADVTVDNATQNQSGSSNTQDMELGIVDMGLIGKGSVTLDARNISQIQSGNNNKQEMQIGKIDKNARSHTVYVTASNIRQIQSGSRNKQKMKIGVVE